MFVMHSGRFWFLVTPKVNKTIVTVVVTVISTREAKITVIMSLLVTVISVLDVKITIIMPLRLSLLFADGTHEV